MMVECGIGQHTAIASIFAQADFTAAEILCDLMGIERVVSVGLPPAGEEDAPASAPDAQQAGEPPGDETADVTEQDVYKRQARRCAQDDRFPPEICGEDSVSAF